MKIFFSSTKNVNILFRKLVLLEPGEQDGLVKQGNPIGSTQNVPVKSGSPSRLIGLSRPIGPNAQGGSVEFA